MPIALLHRLAKLELPTVLHDPNDVENVRILVLAGHVKAQIHSVGRSLKYFAIVVGITPLGQLMLRHTISR